MNGQRARWAIEFARLLIFVSLFFSLCPEIFKKKTFKTKIKPTSSSKLLYKPMPGKEVPSSLARRSQIKLMEIG